MSNPTVAGSKEVLLRKLTLAVFSSILSQLVFSLVFLGAVHLDPFHPLEWLRLSAVPLASLELWLYLCPLTATIFALGVICAKDYTTEAKPLSTRFRRLASLASWRNLCMLLLHVLIGVGIVWLYSALLGGEFGALRRGQFLVEGRLFLLLNGVWAGIYYFAKEYLLAGKLLPFPIIEQSKPAQFKGQFWRIFASCVKRDSLWATGYFSLAYCLRGASVRDWCAEKLRLMVEHPQQTVFSHTLLLQALLFTAIFSFSIHLMKFFFMIYLTEHWVFPIESEHPATLTLAKALEVGEYPIIQHLACLDLYKLATWDHLRRAQLFSLSLPGGHPHNWNSILQPTLRLITTFTGELNLAVDRLLAPAPQPELLVPQATAGPSVPQPSYRYRMRDLTMQPAEVITLTEPSCPETPTELEILRKVSESIQRKIGIKYLFGEVPEARIQFLLEHGQPLVWAVQGLALTAAASLTEDNYGVVQKDLPAVIAALVGLKQATEKLNKVALPHRKAFGEQTDSRVRMKIALRSAVKRSLYCISTAFGSYASELRLNKDVRQAFQAFVMFKE